ncbi:hypothetical protein GCM10009741_27230 [Kribbella lupini]|uniref:Uncharacterized protein n=1 Tax=Kribbella lupini TaxID=291602 RepID=A0ABN2ARL9_9ACTN
MCEKAPDRAASGVQWSHELFSRGVGQVMKDVVFLAVCVATFAAVWLALRGVEKL